MSFGSVSIVVPALLISTSRRPKASSQAASIALTPDSSATLHFTAKDSAPSAAQAATVSSARAFDEA